MNQNHIPRPEHPRPQYLRTAWENLNGEWEFAFDFSVSKKEEGFVQNGVYEQKITVPFCPESELSGIGFTNFIPAVWYRKKVTLDTDALSGRVLLHFGAVDYHAEVYVNGNCVGTHDGGYVSFTFDITAAVKEGENEIVVYAVDDRRSGKQPSGKQSYDLYSSGCMYTRTTGIWQTVWLEYVPNTYLKTVKVYPNAAAGSVNLQAYTNQMASGMTFTATAYFAGKEVGKAEALLSGCNVNVELKLSEKHLWAVGEPNLYDVVYTLGEDRVESYFGLRSVSLSKNAICLNDKPVFQRLVLDQGFYPDGIYTAPSDEALKNDIILGQKVGFNGARLHEKIFEERYLYWADKLGYLVWGEYPNWGFDYTQDAYIQYMLPEWIEEIERDFNHPSLVGWCPFNETWDQHGCKQSDSLIAQIYQVTKALDPTRPCIDVSGGFHVISDIYDIHDYQQDPAKFAARYAPMANDMSKAPVGFPQRECYEGQPYFVSEYGGTWWNAEIAKQREAESGENYGTPSWGYGDQCKTETEAGQRIAALTKVLLDNPNICAFCYTQITDVEQEQNGMFDYHRRPKFSDEVYEVIRAGFTAPAAVEKE